MGQAIRVIVIGTAAFALQGCLAKTAIDVATLPVKVASSGVDLATTSQAEADQKRGREIRRREEQLGRLQRDYEKQIDRCGKGDRRACDQARESYAEIQVLLPSIPVEAEGS
ncbi:MAG TPA: hypothetical protein VI168_09290 [Croceibacterium sp.]